MSGEACNNSSACLALNASDTDDQLTQAMVDVVSIVVPILFSMIFIIGLIGNSLVVLVVSANAQMRSTTNLLIINLAVADLLFIIFCVPSTASDYVLTYWPFGEVWCRTVQYLIVVTAYASVYTLVLMSVDRFLAVVHPIKSMSVRTERHAVMAIAVLWVLIVSTSVPVYYSHGVNEYPVDNTTVHAVCSFLDKDFNWAAFQISFFVTSYVLPLALICGLYLCIVLRLWRGVAPGGRVSAESRRGKRRVTRLVVVVVATFAFCWFPIQLILMLKSIDRYDISTGSIIAQIVSHVLAYTNACVNPILYAFLSENFRKAFRKLIYCWPASASAATRTNLPPDGAHDPPEGTKTTKTNGNNDFL